MPILVLFIYLLLLSKVEMVWTVLKVHKVPLVMLVLQVWLVTPV
jgi:hypothetical protein